MTANFPESPASINLNKKALIVLGMHRSGTSALTRVLNLCGAALPQQLMPPVKDNNEAGFWESSQIMAVHDQLLASAGSAWDDFSQFPPSWFNSAMALEFQEKMLVVLEEEFGETPLFVLKDPRICRLVPFWLKVLEAFAAKPYFILPIRHPLEVAASLKQRDGFNQAKSLLLWLQHFLAAERDTRNQLRIFLTYDQLLFDWQGVISRIENELGIVFGRRSHQVGVEIDEFLRLDWRHHQEKLNDLSVRKDIVNWVAKVYDWGLRASKGEVVGLEELDEITQAFLEADKAYGPIIATNKLKQVQQMVEIKELSEQLMVKTQSLSDKSEEVSKLQQSLEDRDRQIEELEKQLADFEDHELILTESIKEQEKLATDLGITQQKLQELQQTLGEREKRLGLLESALIKRDHRIEDLQSQLDNALMKAEFLKTESISHISLPTPQPLSKRVPQLISWTMTFKLLQKLQEEKHYKIIAQSGLFDRDYYLSTYPDVAKAGVDPIEHYLNHYYEGRNPNSNFDTNYYLQTNSDVAQAKINPLLHYILYGREEGRKTQR